MSKSCAKDISLNSVETMMAGCLLMRKQNSCDTAFFTHVTELKKMNQARHTKTNNFINVQTNTC
jgi:hypothetical protein